MILCPFYEKKRCNGKKFAGMNAAIGLFNTFGSEKRDNGG